MNKLIALFVTTLFLTSCSGEETTVVEPVQKNDKTLTCEEILYEINDSEYYTKQANEKKSLGIKSIVMPLGYIDTYMTADEAISAANQRISYLKKIYDIKGCEVTAEDMKMQRNLQKTLQSPASQNLQMLQPMQQMQQYQTNPYGNYQQGY